MKKLVPDSFIKTTGTSLEPVFLPYFLHGFWGKIFLTLYFFNWPNFIAWLRLRFEIFWNICIVIIWCPAYDVISFEINHNFLIKPFFYITKKSRQKSKFLKNEKSFSHETKSFFHHFKRAFNCQNCLRYEISSLRKHWIYPNSK